MSAGFQVILEDIGAMAGKFDSESGEVSSLASCFSHAPVSTGDRELDGMLGAALTTLEGLNRGITNKLRQHADTLRDCQSSYKSTDSDHARLLDTMMKLSWGG